MTKKSHQSLINCAQPSVLDEGHSFQAGDPRNPPFQVDFPKEMLFHLRLPSQSV